MIDELLGEQKKLSQSKRWQDALKVNDQLINLYPNLAFAYKDRSRFFRRLGDLKSAEEAMSFFLELKCGVALEALVEEVSCGLKKALGESSVESCYKITSSGGLNFGVIEHKTSRGDEFFTKIVNSKTGEAECFFYNQIRPRFETLENITLNLSHYYETKKGGLAFLTLPKISGRHASLEQDREKIFSVYQTLVEIKQEDIASLFLDDTNGKKPEIFMGKELKLSRIFLRLYDVDMLEEIFLWIKKKLEKLKVIDSVRADFNRLEDFLITKKCFEKLNSQCDFKLMHGDFHQGNMLLSSEGRIFLIDWPSIHLAPKGVDLTKTFRREKWPFEKIRDEFLENDQVNAGMQEIERCVFSFAMIITWLNFSPQKTIKQYDDFIGPAMDYLLEGLSRSA